jgi:hypothetical protein
LCVKLVTYQNYTKLHGLKNIKSTDTVALTGTRITVTLILWHWLLLLCMRNHNVVSVILMPTFFWLVLALQKIRVCEVSFYVLFNSAASCIGCYVRLTVERPCQESVEYSLIKVFRIYCQLYVNWITCFNVSNYNIHLLNKYMFISVLLLSAGHIWQRIHLILPCQCHGRSQWLLT